MPSGAFGLNDTGQNAMGRMGEIPNWFYEWMKQNAANSNVAQKTGQANLDQYQYYLNNMLQNYGQPGAGFFSPDQIKEYGSQVMPGVGPAIQDRLSRLNSLSSGLSGVPSGQQTADALYGNLAGEGQYTNDITSGLQKMLADQYGGMFNTAGEGNAAFNKNLGDTYGTLMQGVNTTFPYLRQASSDTFGGLGDQNKALYSDLINKSNSGFGGMAGASDSMFGNLADTSNNLYSDLGGKTGAAYDASTKNVERLLPGGDLRAAAAARSFAPAMAAAQRRLRTAGIDPNSPEASGILQGVDVARGHSMDDILAANNGDYIKSLNDLTLGKNQAQTGLALGGLQNNQGLRLGGLQNKQGLMTQALMNAQGLGQGQFQNAAGFQLGGMQNEQGLAQQQDALIRSLGLDQGNQYRGQLLNNMGTTMGLQQGQGQQGMGLADANYLRNMGIFQNRDQITQAARQMGLQDWQIQNMLAGQYNDANMQGIDLNTQMFNQGVGGLARGQANQNAAAGQLGNLGQWYTGQGQNYQNSARGSGSTAFDQYGQDLGLESQNAGWLTKMLTGMAAPALGMIPGIGPFLAGAAGGMAGGASGGYGGSTGSYGAGGFGGGGYGGGYGGAGASNPSSGWGGIVNFFKPQGVSQPGVGSSSWNQAFNPSALQWGFGG